MMIPWQFLSFSSLSKFSLISCKNSKLKLLTGFLFSSRMATFPSFSTLTRDDMDLI